jgi:hypothetical protein
VAYTIIYYSEALQAEIIPNYPFAKNCVIPAQAGIQMIKKSSAKRATSRFCPLRGMFAIAGFPPARE